ncbi:MAG: ATP-binding cassette domain-containing protein [Chthoniobacteraceae bacterium]
MIKVRNLKKTFGPKVAVNGVSFTVEKGEVLGFLGPNGAGKSTSMRMITGFIPPTSGEVSIGGFDIVNQPIEAKRLIGYLPENAPSYADMSVGGFLAFAAELRGMRGAERSKAVDRAIEMCFLEAVRHQSIETLSKGFRHRTGFAQSIIHDPEVLILDEPTDGLDPNQKHEVRMLIRRMGEKKAIIFSTHILEEVEAVCSRAIIIDRGTIVANGTPQELKRRSENAGAVTLSLAEGLAATVTAKVNQISGVARSVVVSESPLTVRAFPGKNGDSGDVALALGEVAAREKWRIRELHTEEGRLDEVFRNITLPDTDMATKGERV